MDKRLLILSFFFLLVVMGKSQGRLNVIVKDSATREVLPGVSVAFLTIPLGLSTDAKGKAFFPKVLDGKYSIKLNYIGYKEKIISIEIPTDTLRNVFLTSEE